MQLLTSPMPLSPEVIDDRVATVLDAGANITLNYDDAANVLTISAATSATGAPTDAEYVTSTVNGTLSAERVLTDTATVTWDRTTPGQIKAIAASGTSYTDEQAQDAVGNILQDSATIDYVYNDATPYITGLVKDNSITESMLSLSDNTTKDATISTHGLLMKLSGNTVHFLRGDGTWVTPPTGTSYTDEQAQDTIGAILLDSATIDFTYNDATPSITASIIAGSISATELTNDSVTYAKIQNVTDNRLLGRSAGSNGDVQELTTGTGLTLSGGVLSASGGGGGAPTDADYITSTTNATLTAERVLTDTATITWDRTTAGQIKANAALEGIQDIIGIMVASTATIQLVYTDAADQLTANVIAGSIGTTQLTNDGVTYAKIQNVTDNRLLGRSAGSTGDVQEITIGTGLTLASGQLVADTSRGIQFLFMGA